MRFFRDVDGSIKRSRDRNIRRKPTRAEHWAKHPFCSKCGIAVENVPGGFHCISGVIRCNGCAPELIADAHHACNRRRGAKFARNARIRPIN